MPIPGLLAQVQPSAATNPWLTPEQQTALAQMQQTAAQQRALDTANEAAQQTPAGGDAPPGSENPEPGMLDSGSGSGGSSSTGGDTPPGSETVSAPSVQVPQSAPEEQQTGSAPSVQRPGPATTPSATAVRPGAKPYDEHQALADLTKVNEGEISDYQRQEEDIQKRQDALKSGYDQAGDLLKKAGIDDWLSQEDIKMAGLKAARDETARAADQKQKTQEYMSMEVDPRHWWKKEGTAGSILGAISIAAGAFAAAMPHSGNNTNQALKIIDDAIGRDIDAQRDNIEKKGKEVSMLASENDRQYTHQMFSLQQQRSDARDSYTKALGLVDRQIGMTNNRDSIMNLDALRNGLQQKVSDKTKELIQMRLQVAQHDIARAAAAAAGTQVSAKDITKQAMTLYADPNWNPPAGMNREEGAVRAARAVLTGGAGGPGGSVIKAAPGGNNQDFDTGVADIQARFDAVAAHNPLINYGATPNSTDAQHIRERDQLNSDIVAGIHQASPGIRSPELIKETAGPFMITKWDNKETVQKKKEAFGMYLTSHGKLSGKNKGTDQTGAGDVPGATEDE